MVGPVKSKNASHKVHKPTELEWHMVKVIDRHATRVARWGLGVREEVRSDILAGIWRIWKLVSHLSMDLLKVNFYIILSAPITECPVTVRLRCFPCRET
jgi:hypothetical protein